MNDSSLPPHYEGLVAELLRGLRHELNNRAHVMALSLPLLRAVADESVAHLRKQKAPASLGGVPFEDVSGEVNWVLTQLEERDAALTDHLEALKRALLAERTAATLASVVDDASRLAASTLLKAGAQIAAAAPALNVPGPQRGQLLTGVTCLLLGTPPGASGTIRASAELDGEHPSALIFDLPGPSSAWLPAVARAREVLAVPIVVSFEESPQPCVRFGWSTT